MSAFPLRVFPKEFGGVSLSGCGVAFEPLQATSSPSPVSPAPSSSESRYGQPLTTEGNEDVALNWAASSDEQEEA